MQSTLTPSFWKKDLFSSTSFYCDEESVSGIIHRRNSCKNHKENSALSKRHIEWLCFLVSWYVSLTLKLPLRRFFGKDKAALTACHLRVNAVGVRGRSWIIDWVEHWNNLVRQTALEKWFFNIQLQKIPIWKHYYRSNFWVIPLTLKWLG